ncbi:hypothetical protein E1262_25755 [Jiangella aurantiaca]|uniref:DUF1049 domain-containing protein n=1 Tax=Jiangella aurantiaca TaxID=2530373 RepID=A0A4R5A0I9_9ACTN|nr:hypothetical protein [Jiangella aurantiaca]TDD65273.1 hypothetical protein E1262_25755 [Jiangella aurantiaca]
MAIFHRNGNGPEESLTEWPAPVGAGAARAAPAGRGRAAWFAGFVAALALTILVVFVLQNTRDVDLAFLWLDGRVPLALALLVAAACSAVFVTLIRRGTARPSGTGRHTGRATPPG